MSRICQITGKKPLSGNKRSHSMNAKKRKFFPNLHNHRFWLDKEKKFINLRISKQGLRLIDKYGIKKVMEKIKIKYKNV
ncbi:rpmB [Wigglesworthia glossinidia endosymbiont of Glossina brevipalpis]|uniref:Large ribosomal subunit protein bL28 n=1 Tax=Wigglesworthia glossinidia brevipalpis TaxID=36870 RepID=RL28_WIGBR|nr:RecName: Full=Large ribosomal subunit protein bL28; AltName: Full=50S ribosomal protein L28 [Wigglesworthia glossinidia endosymbiont of Glossina brevipalpis]BAC24549.1 rpmB [Wigglesworthia glossinidia endosymbiont of Glossina brevipalpis]